MAETLNFSKFQWINAPKEFVFANGALTLITEPDTDFWQRTYYDFQHANAPAFVVPVGDTEFSFSVKTTWEPRKLFDQCGVVLYQDAENWFKASVEYDNEEFSRLGSVVTNLGYSDWATTDIASAQHSMVYRLSRRGQDFFVENSKDGERFKQMRIFHMHQPIEQAHIGVYACSPLDSSMQAVFSDFSLGECTWELHVNPDQ